MAAPLVVIVPLKLTALGPPHMLKLTDAFTVTLLTITPRGGMTGRLLRLPDVIATLANTQQNWLVLFGSRTYHHVLFLFFPTINAVCPKLITSKEA